MNKSSRTAPETALTELAAKGIRLPPQPGVITELQGLLASDSYSMNEVARIIASDAGIAAMLFKAVHSPVFGGSRKFDSVEQVLMVIGIKQTYNLVQAVSLSTSIADAARKAFETFWNRSREVAQIASLIAADRISVCNVFPDQAYLAGIFFECGVPVLMQRFPDYCSKLQMDTVACWPTLEQEDALYNVDHCSIGYLVAHHWKLPDFICKAILYHNEIPPEEQGAVRTLVAILLLAIHIYHRITQTENRLWHKMRAEVLSELGIHADDEQAYIEEIAEQFWN